MVAVACLLVFLGVFVGVTFARHDRGTCADLGTLDRFPPSSIVKIGCAPIVVTNVDGSLRVLLLVSPTGSGAPITYDDVQRTFRTPHGEIYDATGEPIAGPTTKPMSACPVDTSNGHLVLRGKATRDAETIAARCLAGAANR